MAHFAVSRNATIAALAAEWAEHSAWACGTGDGAQNCNSFTCGQAYGSLYDLAPSPERLGLTKAMDAAVGGASAGYDKVRARGRRWDEGEGVLDLYAR